MGIPASGYTRPAGLRPDLGNRPLPGRSLTAVTPKLNPAHRATVRPDGPATPCGKPRGATMSSDSDIVLDAENIVIGGGRLRGMFHSRVEQTQSAAAGRTSHKFVGCGRPAEKLTRLIQ
jgi:hypothetical protein